MENGTNHICPNCGAAMEMQGLSVVCPFCGTHHDFGNYKRIKQRNVLSWEISERFNYLKNNEQFLKSSAFVILLEKNTTYRIKSNPSYFANDGEYNRILDYSFNLEYFNNDDTESLSLIVNSCKNMTDPYLSFLLDYELQISPIFGKWETDACVFKMTPIELKEICDSHDIEIYSNIIDCEYDFLEEFITYCCRFYNAIFDKRKYLYSLHQLLISDNYGK